VPPCLPNAPWQPGKEIGLLLQKVDPWSNGRITFSEAVTGLATELLQLASQQQQQRSHQHQQQQQQQQQHQYQHQQQHQYQYQHQQATGSLPPPPPPPQHA